jgi:dolichol-phosphate mannosyltransferase
MAVLCRPAVSVVAPCFDEEDVLPLFLSRVGGVLDSLGGAGELVLVDDSSRDRTWGIIEKAAAATERADQPTGPSTTTSGRAGHL